MGCCWQRNRDFNSAWKLSSNKDWPPTEYRSWQKNSTRVAFFCHVFFPRTNSKCVLEGNPKQHKKKKGFFFSEMPGVSANTDILTWWVTSYHNNVGYSIFKQSRADLCTFINRHSWFRQTGRGGEVCPFTRHLIGKERKRGILGKRQGSEPGGFSTKHHPANGMEAWLSPTQTKG